MEATLQVDRYTLPGFYRQKGVNLREDTIEISISELSIRRSGVYFRGSGLAVDVNGETSVEGLFAAGDCATVSGGISGAAVLGHIAGEGAVQRIRKQNGMRPEIDWDDAELTRERGRRIARRDNGLPWKEFERRTRQCVTDHVGVRRTRRSLKLALDTLFALAKQEDHLVADDLHGMMRVHESRNIRLNAEIMSTAALAREESRTGSAHHRLDFPDQNDEKFRKFMVVDKGADGKARVKTLDSNLPLSASFDRVSQAFA
jgi:succinate dehydrogenase/fumarate reductase flavoprotein subunit